MKKSALFLSAVAALGLMGLASCEKHNNHDDNAVTNKKFAEHENATPSVIISKDGKISAQDARIRIPLGGKNMTSGYVTLNNSGDKPVDIVSGSTDYAKRLELHAHTKNADGMMQMRKVDKFTIPAHGTLTLEPMGNHMMFFDTKEITAAGTKIPITLITADGNKLSFQATMVSNSDMIKQDGASGKMDSHNMNHMDHMQ